MTRSRQLPTTGALDAEAIEAMASHAREAAMLLKALANENRLLILCRLVEGERSVGELNERVPLSQSALSQHLSVLRRDGLVNTRRDAQTIYYSLVDGPALELIGTLHSVYCCTDDESSR